jgi:sodium/hydrogen antiporter
MVLFLNASTVDRKELMKEKSLPIRLLFIGLPLTMIAGFLLAIPLFPGMNWWILLLMALILAPTDAALGIAVVTSKRVPASIRQTINVESGLNDGFALPPILICFAALSETSTAAGSGFSYWSLFVLKQFIYGPLIGGAVGWLGGWLVERSAKREWMNPTFQSLSAIALAVLAFSLAEMVHGNGFISAYFAGLMLSTQTKSVRDRLHEFGESESQALVLVIFLLFGLILVPLAFPYWDLRAWIYALLSLTMIRMIPVAISLMGTRLSWGTIGFIGWFGPRGIASILYLLLVILELGAKGYEKMISVIVLTVILSVFLHGITANPLTKLYKEQRKPGT